MTAQFPTLRNVEAHPDFRYVDAHTYCPDCDRGRQYLDTGPSGLSLPCESCGGDWVQPVHLNADDFDELDRAIDPGTAPTNPAPIMRDSTAMALCILIAVVAALAIGGL